jgi:acetyl-CoA C-acetyltransferase
MSAPRPVFVAAAQRTAIGKFFGAFADTPQPRMLAPLIRAALDRLGLPGDAVDEVLSGSARQAGVGPNPARQAALFAGLPVTVPAMTVNMACGSSLKAVIDGAQKIGWGEAELIIAAGAENMSRVPHLLTGMRRGMRLGHQEVLDDMTVDGFLCQISGKVMGETAETLAEQYGISREEQDKFALGSQQKAASAAAHGWFDAEITPLELAGKKGPVTISADEHPRPDSSLDSLRKLPPVFKKEGSVTAGNSSGITDGAALLILCSEAALKKHRLEPLARITASAQAGVPPEIMGIGPVPAVRKLFEKTRLGWSDIGLVELNEAFAAQVLACTRDLQLPMDKLNVNGGAIALGHPIGATGARICVTLIHEMIRREEKRGLATLCISGGLGLAALFERE